MNMRTLNETAKVPISVLWESTGTGQIPMCKQIRDHTHLTDVVSHSDFKIDASQVRLSYI